MSYDKKDPKLISGTQIANSIKEETKILIQELKEKQIVPKFASILVGADEGSVNYSNAKKKACLAIGIDFLAVEEPGDSTTEHIIETIKKLNEDKSVNGIMLHVPLPKGVDTEKIIESIDPAKDVDGLTSTNAGNLIADADESKAFSACTAMSIITIIESLPGMKLEGKKVALINRTKTIGKPLIQLLINRKAIVTVCHSCTPTEMLHQITREADIIVTASGKPGLLTADMIHEGAIVIDAGFSMDSQGHISGDSDISNVLKVCGRITPPTGGVGPVTTAILLRNTGM